MNNRHNPSEARVRSRELPLGFGCFGQQCSMIMITPQDAGRHDSVIDRYIVVKSVEEALAREMPILGFLLSGLDSPILEKTAWALRRSQYWFAPIFTAEDNPHPLLDGYASQVEAIAKSERMQALLRSLPLDIEALQLDERLLAFLYIRDGGQLQPQFDRNLKTLYHYPIVEALSTHSKTPENFLEELTRRRLLLEQNLIDRVRCCLKCGSAHHNYIDVCPNCTSIAIGKTPAIHCFTCGFVGAEQDFHTPTGMVCPRCRARLRHIGVDYDKPLTQFSCRDCRHVFVEPDVIAKCLYCETRTPPDDLDPKEIYQLSLSAQGRTVLRSGRLDESFAYLDLPHSVSQNFFMRLLDWALAAYKRHPDLGFGLVMLEIISVRGFLERIGFQRGYHLLDEILRRLDELLRDTDVVTRTDEYRLWIFLPMSSVDGFVSRLQRTLDELLSNAPEKMEIRVRSAQTLQNIDSEDTAQTIMRKLEASEHV